MGTDFAFALKAIVRTFPMFYLSCLGGFFSTVGRGLFVRVSHMLYLILLGIGLFLFSNLVTSCYSLNVIFYLFKLWILSSL